jgi:endonuclease/exonuclease/phosphatase family metal-dependent hydrolase
MKRHGSYAGIAVVVALFVLVLQGCDTSPPPAASLNAPGRISPQTEFLFCHWNVENFFDDRNDGRTGPGDKEYDPLFANRPDLLHLKLAKLTEAILKMNAGKGPDILSIVEVESLRAAELLQKALNDKLTDPKLHYQHILMKEHAGGRHIAPAILTRLPVVQDRTRSLGNRQRILEGRVVVNGHELILVSSHWTSRLQESGKRGRADYADKIYGACNAIYHSNPAADFLVSGDFNDDPDDDSVTQHLHASGELQTAGAVDSLRLVNLFAGKDPKEYGTHYYKKWHIFDQILISPGLLDGKGWSCDPQSLQVFNELHRAKDKLQRPWRFGSEHEKGERGYSDHFPVMVRLRVER